MAKVKKILKYYWDSCVFIAGIAGEVGREPIIKDILEQCQLGNVMIYTSVLSITEVAFVKAEKDDKELDQKIEDAINELWAPCSNIIITEFHELMAIKAKSIMRDAITRGWSIKAPDAIHLATAKSIGVDEFHTYDNPLRNKTDTELGLLLGYKISEPNKEPSLFDGIEDTNET